MPFSSKIHHKFDLSDWFFWDGSFYLRAAFEHWTHSTIEGGKSNLQLVFDICSSEVWSRSFENYVGQFDPCFRGKSFKAERLLWYSLNVNHAKCVIYIRSILQRKKKKWVAWVMVNVKIAQLFVHKRKFDFIVHSLQEFHCQGVISEKENTSFFSFDFFMFRVSLKIFGSQKLTMFMNRGKALHVSNCSFFLSS